MGRLIANTQLVVNVIQLDACGQGDPSATADGTDLMTLRDEAAGQLSDLPQRLQKRADESF